MLGINLKHNLEAKDQIRNLLKFLLLLLWLL